ncbi:zinc finger BED domain-containing protein 1-like [Belonocnema kinseyi]|uniref:zinc finger BED domain-containing protein 1-like n=1 Tax=Belonocnema kinseyi TaxID=2817044 RepID=UPI00143DAE0F|nr:zinc finger BED domain-containing protein 1-like [Belonocnema kinseyi]
MPSKTTFANYLDKKYDEISDIYKEKLKGVADITLTTDLWTDTLNTTSFLGITAHFLDGSKMATVILGCYEFPKSHTSANITEKIQEVCADWSIRKDQLSAIVTDNASNVVKAVKDFLDVEGHIGCAAHKINLIAQNSIEGVTGLPDLIQKVRNIVTWFKHSNKASYELKAGSSLKLKQDVKTRWNSTFCMIVRFIERRGVVFEVMYNHPDPPPMVTPKEIEELIEVSKILKPLEEITHEIKLRFGRMKEVKHFAVATLLDSRFKKIDFKDHSRCARAIAIVKTPFDRKVQASALNGSESDESSEIFAGKKNSPEVSIWSRHHKLPERDQRRKSDITDELPPELSLFLRNPVISLKTDPLKWWVDNKSSYPTLTSIDLRYITIMATSVPSERLFSKAGENMTARRNRLSGERLRKQLFLSSAEWL